MVALGGMTLAAGTASFTPATASRSDGDPASVAHARDSGAIVVDWNRALLRIVRTKGAQPATIHPTRSFAILHAAIDDAVVSITHDGTPYLLSVNAPRGARPDAAAAEAGHDTLASLYPAMKAGLDSQLAGELSVIPNGEGKRAGIKVGHDVAGAILGVRADDGSSNPPPAFVPGTKPGDYRPTPPNFAPAVFTGWSQVTPFVLRDASQFRPAAPPSLTSAAYANAINEVQSLGQDTSTTRTADETTAAKFWAAPIWNYWNEIAQNAVLEHHTDLAETARLFSDLNLTFADGVIAFYDAKYAYHLWRPITAIREAASTGNPGTTADPTWSPLATTPADPSYPGAHSVISEAGATVLTSFFGRHDRLTVTSELLPGVTRTFAGYQAAASEAGLSRIFAGLHTRLDHEAGLRLGGAVAGFVLEQQEAQDFGLAGA
jgi:hypothetical protein